MKLTLASLVAGVASILVPAGAQPPPNVLLVTIDTVRADHIGAYGYTSGSTPVLDRLAREGVRFADATTQAPLTGPAHAALLTGMYPARFSLRDNATTPVPPEVVTVAEAFKASGYRTGGFVGAFILDHQYGFGKGFDEFDDRFADFRTSMKLSARRIGGEVTDAAIKWLAAPSARPFFAWVHLYDAHAPYEAPAPYRTRFRGAPYDGAIAYVDACIGRLIESLEKSGRLDHTIVSVIADHGESLGEHGEQQHGVFLYDTTLHVPWILRLPGKAHAGTVVGTQVRAIDVTPTIEQLAGVPVGRGLDGGSVVAEIGGRTRRDPPPSYAETFYPKLHFGLSELRSVRVGDWKYIDAPRPELYDLRKDPGEIDSRIGTRPELAAGLSAEARKIEAAFGPEPTATAVTQPDPETLARLRSLGYVGVVSAGGPGRGEDPKDAIERLERLGEGLSRAQQMLGRGRAEQAVPILEQLLKENDRSFELHLTLGDAYRETGRPREAIDEYAAASLSNPRAAVPLLAAARAYLAVGDAAQAREKVEAAERLEPETSDVHVVRGMIYEQAGRGPEALREYQTALQANRSNPEARARVAGMALQLGQLDLAGEQFRALLQIGYRPSRMHFGLGQVAQRRGDLKRAAAEYREALRLEPAFTPAQTALQSVER
ncbi:MAG: sulfatase-like hydrolase/transferase [Betaproteobacteria bacterium]